jgi:hypothetical protein
MSSSAVSRTEGRAQEEAHPVEDVVLVWRDRDVGRAVGLQLCELLGDPANGGHG